MMTTAETAVRERIASSPFTVAELTAVAMEHADSPKAAQSIANRVVQAEVLAKRIRRLGGGKWGVCEPPPPPKPKRGDEDEESEWERYARAQDREFVAQAMGRTGRA